MASRDNTNEELFSLPGAIEHEELETTAITEDSINGYANIEFLIGQVAYCELTVC